MSTTFETLNEILNVIGKLDDNEGTDTARERFRRFLQQKVCDVRQIQEYVEECLRNSGDQYYRALQDLVNHLGRFLGFDVTFGRYQGMKGKIGFDGHWKSRTDFHIVVEVKTTDVYSIKAATLVGYVDELISEKSISSWDDALGLYVVGRSDAGLRQLENTIIAEKRTNQLRVISTMSLLTLAELMNKYQITHEEILALLRPSGPKIDPIINLMTRLVAEHGSVKVAGLEEEPLSQELASEGGSNSSQIYFKSDNKGMTEEGILLTEQEERYAPVMHRSHEAAKVKGTKPTAISILGQTFAVTTWRDVLVQTMNTIADVRPEKFEQIMKQFPYRVGPDKKRFTVARVLKNGTYIEVNLSADSILHLCFQVLETIGLSTEDLVIEYE